MPLQMCNVSFKNSRLALCSLRTVSIMSPLPPEPAAFPTRQLLEAHAQARAARQGYALVVKMLDESRIVLECN
jgi:hypothetical protein